MLTDEERTERDPAEMISFSAVIPTNLSSAIKIDGDDQAGGRLTLDIPGTDIAPLLMLTMLRGKLLKITVQEAV
jgi:hypothetical protein